MMAVLSIYNLFLNPIKLCEMRKLKLRGLGNLPRILQL